jgi:hypothetical protein
LSFSLRPETFSAVDIRLLLFSTAALSPVTISVGLFRTFLFSGRRFCLLASSLLLFRRPIRHFSFLKPTLLPLGFFLAPFPSARSALFFSQADAFASWLLPCSFSVGLFGTFLFSGRRFCLLASSWLLFRRPIRHFSFLRPTLSTDLADSPLMHIYSRDHPERTARINLSDIGTSVLTYSCLFYQPPCHQPGLPINSNIHC